MYFQAWRKRRVSDALSLVTGFPGDITGPFDQVIKCFSETEQVLRENVEALDIDALCNLMNHRTVRP